MGNGEMQRWREMERYGWSLSEMKGDGNEWKERDGAGNGGDGNKWRVISRDGGRWRDRGRSFRVSSWAN